MIDKPDTVEQPKRLQSMAKNDGHSPESLGSGGTAANDRDIEATSAPLKTNKIDSPRPVHGWKRGLAGISSRNTDIEPR